MEQLPRLSDYYPRLAKIGQAIIRWATGPEPLASHGDHFLNPHEFIPFEETDGQLEFFEGADLSTWPKYEPVQGDPYAPNGWHETVVSEYLKAKE